MGMVVRTNTMAINANRQLGANNNQVAKSLEKLSSGYRINRAGDDASGLAISEKMKAQIKGLEQASANAQDGISLVQTAEGSLAEVHDMLNRMVELAEKSANGILEDEDRSALQDEMDALATEIDRIADSANFNNRKLFDGSMSTSGGARLLTFAVDANNNGAALSTSLDFKFATAASEGAEGVADAEAQEEFAKAIGGGTTVSFTVDNDWNFSASGLPEGYELLVKATGQTDGKDVYLSTTTPVSYAEDATGINLANATSFVIRNKDGEDVATLDIGASATYSPGTTKIQLGSASVPSYSYSIKSDAALTADTDTVTIGEYEHAIVAANGTTFDAQMQAVASGYNDSGAAYTASWNSEEGAMTFTKRLGADPDVESPTIEFSVDTVEVGEMEENTVGEGLKLQIGDSNHDYDKLVVGMDDMHMSALFDSEVLTDITYNGKLGKPNAVLRAVEDSTTQSLDISTQDNAAAALKAVKSVITKVSTQRGKLGAIQNRLEHTINNLDTTTENMTAANSRIRDTDMAKEMMNYTKMNVLVQSAQAMLAQANQQPQSILQLLQ